MRSPLSKRSIEELTLDMAAVIALYAQASPDGTVTKDDLHRAGFSNGEIDQVHGDAVAAAEERLQPYQADTNHGRAA
jgi:hypothetical protein